MPPERRSPRKPTPIVALGKRSSESPRGIGLERLPPAELVRAELDRRRPIGFAEFVDLAWPHVFGTPLVESPANLEMLRELAELSDTRRLIITSPERTLKATFASIFLPAWEWGPLRRSHFRSLSVFSSASEATIKRVRFLDLVTGLWYRQRWPVAVDSKSNVETAQGGIAIFSGPEVGPLEPVDRLSFLDPHGWDWSEQKRGRVASLWQELSIRACQPGAQRLVAARRVHAEDLVGLLLTTPEAWRELRLPARDESGRLQFKALWDDVSLSELERELGPAGVLAQLMQTPEVEPEVEQVNVEFRDFSDLYPEDTP